MNFEEFLQERATEGRFDSEGSFTLNFEQAAERLAAFRLPSPVHYLLKVVQVASRLGATSIRVRLERFRTAITFRAHRAGAVTDFESITRAFLAPLEVEDPILADLAAALWGAQGATTQEILWSFSEGYRGRRVYIKNCLFRTEAFELQVPIPEGEPPCAFHLSVIHHKSWRFWTHARRNADSLALLSANCIFSALTVTVDGRKLEKANGNYPTEHRRINPFGETSARPYHNIFYDLSSQGGFQTGRPALSQYVVRERCYNVWASGTRPNNRLVPDGISSPAWMLQFRQDNANLSMREVSKFPHCRLVLAYDEKEAVEEVPLRLTLVRQSVLLQRPASAEWGKEFVKWFGCHLILDEDTLPTDLTGFQIIENERLTKLLESLEPRLEWCKAYFSHGRALVHC